MSLEQSVPNANEVAQNLKSFNRPVTFQNDFPQIVNHGLGAYVYPSSAPDPRKLCHQALKTSDYESFKNTVKPRTKGTCSWVLDHPRYHAWRDNPDSDLLWISADPGCGKSVLARAFVDDDDFSMPNPASICYFFFKDNEEQESLITALCALLHQLFSIKPELLSYALSDWERDGSKLRLEIDKLWRIFTKATADKGAGQIVCIIDALDECRVTDRTKLIELLRQTYLTNKEDDGRSTVKWVVTSRPYADLERGFSKVPEIRLRGEDESSKLRSEIDLVIRERVQELASELQLDEHIKDQLETKLLQLESRTYLWLYLAFDDIQASYENSFRLDQASIDNLPSSVQSAYEKILAKIPEGQQVQARQVLAIVVGARRPLQIEELAYALGILNGDGIRNLEEAKRNTQRDLKAWIRRCCGLFVFFSDSKVFLIHQTAKDFLLEERPNATGRWSGSLSKGYTDYEMGRVCILCLNCQDFEDFDLHPRTDAVRECLEPKEQLLDYCAKSWTIHLVGAYPQLSKAVQYELDRLHDAEGHWCQEYFYRKWSADFSGSCPDDITTLDVCVSTAHIDMAERICRESKANAIGLGSQGSHALYMACSLGLQSFVDLLIQSGVDVNASNRWHFGALCAAAEHGHASIVETLLRCGVNPNVMESDQGWTPLQAAAEKGHHNIIDLLLRSTSGLTKETLGSTLTFVAGQGNVKIVERLLGAGASPRACEFGDIGISALQKAASHGHNDIVNVLVDRGADMHASSEFSGNALEQAAFHGHSSTVRLLIDRGAMTRRNKALLRAASRGNTSIVEQLLDAGAEIGKRNRWNATALHEAVLGRALDTATVLIRRGVNIDAVDAYGDTAHAVAERMRFTELAQLIADQGVRNTRLPEVP